MWSHAHLLLFGVRRESGFVPLKCVCEKLSVHMNRGSHSGCFGMDRAFQTPHACLLKIGTCAVECLRSKHSKTKRKENEKKEVCVITCAVRLWVCLCVMQLDISLRRHASFQTMYRSNTRSRAVLCYNLCLTVETDQSGLQPPKNKRSLKPFRVK